MLQVESKVSDFSHIDIKTRENKISLSAAQYVSFISLYNNMYNVLITLYNVLKKTKVWLID